MKIRGPLVAAALLALGLAGCDTSGRFSDGGGLGRQALAAPAPPLRNQTFTPAPTARVESSPLPPLVSQPLPPSTNENAALGGLPPVGSSVSIDPEIAPPAPRPVATPVAPPVAAPAAPQQVASARPEPAPQGTAAPTRTGVTGNWTAKEAAGGSCRMTLSSAPTLDLYKASSAGCQSRELQRVSAWELRGEEIYLYEPGGGVAARLKQSGRNFEGTSAKTGAPVTLSK
jgi:hypothetical protein